MDGLMFVSADVYAPAYSPEIRRVLHARWQERFPGVTPTETVSESTGYKFREPIITIDLRA
jgi:hypothetical protein